MKGLWDKSKASDTAYRPGLDALRAVDPSTLVDALYAVVEQGCALMVGATRDGGAVSLILMDGNERHKLYPSSADELNTALRDLVESFARTASEPPQPRRKR